jgi:hypothetical protein
MLLQGMRFQTFYYLRIDRAARSQMKYILLRPALLVARFSEKVYHLIAPET